MKIEEDVEQLRSEIARAAGASRGRGGGYPVSVRERVVAYASERRAAGEKLSEVSARIGLCSTTINKWRRGPEPFRRVNVVRSASKITLVSPTGWRADVDMDVLATMVDGR